MPVQLNGADLITSFSDVEEGVWTPVIRFSSAGDSSIIHNIQVGEYTKLGNKIIAQFRVRTSTFTHTTANGSLQITGLPFTSSSVSNQETSGSLIYAGVTMSVDMVMLHLAENSSILDFFVSLTAAGIDTLQDEDMPTGGIVEFYGAITFSI